MTAQANRASRIATATRRGAINIGRAILDMYKLGFTAWWLVPGFVAISAATEFAQHVAEIRMGMFTSREVAHAIANSALRWDFGYVKLAGLGIAMILIGRYWAVGRSWRRALFVPLPVVGKTLVAVAVFVGVGLALSSNWLVLPTALDIARSVVSFILQTGLMAWIAGIVFEDDTITLRRAFTERFPTAIVMTALFFMAILVPSQFVHGLDHKFALGQPAVVVWLLMTFDALVVGTMAALAGSGLYVGYKSGLTWRGWQPVDLP